MIAPDVHATIHRMATGIAAHSRHCPVTAAELETDGLTAAWRAGPVSAGIQVRRAQWAMFARRRFGYGAHTSDRSTSNVFPDRVPLDLCHESQMVCPESEPEADLSLDTERRAQVALAAMTPRQRECVRLWLWEGRGSYQIGKELGIDAAVVRRHIARGLVNGALALGADPMALGWERVTPGGRSGGCWIRRKMSLVG